MRNRKLQALAIATFATCSFAWLACATIPDFLIVTSGSGIDASAVDGGAPIRDSGVGKIDGATDSGAILVDADTYQYRMFVSTPQPGFFAQGLPDSLAKADSICAIQADPLGSVKKWKALLVVLGQDAGLARIGTTPTGWFRVDGTNVIAPGDPPIQLMKQNALFVDGGEVSPEAGVWLGGRGADCLAWGKDGTSSSVGGAAYVADRSLVVTTSLNCGSNTLSFYCFEVP